jgi:hypothetical protein
MRSLRLLLTAIALLAVALASASVALADTPAQRATSITFGGASPTRVKGQVALSATLKADDGKPLSNRSIDFYESVQLLGARDSYLGAALTDSTGTATLGYEPASVGARAIRASFAGEEGLAKSETSGQVTISQTRPLFTEDPLPFAVVGQLLPYALGAVVLAVWALLAFVLVRTASGIRAASPTTSRARRPALGGVMALGAAATKQSVQVGEEWK